jgi:hypothetical protein
MTVASSVLTTTDINGGTVDATTIGATTPSTIAGTTGSFSGDLTIADKIVHSGDTNTAIRFPAADTVTVETNGSERMRIDSAGNVGIGVSSPTVRLDVASAGDVVKFDTTSLGGLVLSRSNAVGNNSSHFTISFKNSDSTVAGIQTINRTGATTSTGTGYELRTTTEGSVGFLSYYTNNSERMRIDSAGNVGIGVTPSAWGGAGVVALQVGGSGLSNFAGSAHTYYINNTYYDGTNFRYINSSINAHRYRQIFNGGHAWDIAPSGTAGNAITFTQAMTLDASGNLLVGRTSNDANLTGCTFGPIGGGITGTVSTGTNEIFVFNNTATGGTAKVAFRTANVEKGSIAWTNASTAYNTSSDYRLKENVAPMQNALDTVAQLNPVTYTWKADGSAGQGFIAHELQAVVPDCVTGEKDAVDKDGNPQYQGVDTSFLVATLVKAIQEQQDIITALTARIEALENK